MFDVESSLKLLVEAAGAEAETASSERPESKADMEHRVSRMLITVGNRPPSSRSSESANQQQGFGGFNAPITFNSAQPDETEIQLYGAAPVNVRGLEKLKKQTGTVRTWAERSAGANPVKTPFSALQFQCADPLSRREAKGMLPDIVSFALTAEIASRESRMVKVLRDFLGDFNDTKQQKRLTKCILCMKYARLGRVDQMATALEKPDAYGNKRTSRSLTRDGVIDMIVSANAAAWPEYDWSCMLLLRDELRRMHQDGSETMDRRAATTYTEGMLRIEEACDGVRKLLCDDEATPAIFKDSSFTDWIKAESKAAIKNTTDFRSLMEPIMARLDGAKPAAKPRTPSTSAKPLASHIDLMKVLPEWRTQENFGNACIFFHLTGDCRFDKDNSCKKDHDGGPKLCPIKMKTFVETRGGTWLGA